MLRTHVDDSHRQNFRCMSIVKSSSFSRVSIVAIHSPDNDVATCSTREEAMGFSSRLETRLEGATSSSRMSEDEAGEYTWREEGCDDGKISVDVEACNAKGSGSCHGLSDRVTESEKQ